MDIHNTHKQLLLPVRRAMYDWDGPTVERALHTLFAKDAVVHLAHPFEDLDGASGLYGNALTPLAAAIPDLERRDYIVMAGRTQAAQDWVGCAGYYMGVLHRPWLGIPPTGQLVSMRFHEFYRFVDNEVVEMQALWDIPEVMMQAGVWPMGPSLGRGWMVPGPASCDGLVSAPYDEKISAGSIDVVTNMLIDMGKHPREPVEAMNLDAHWHPRFNWYGPAGIGSMRGIAGFRHSHQIPFLKAMPDRRGGYAGEAIFWGDGAYVGVTAWPGMQMTFTGDGWLGIVPTNQPISMRSLDFWRIENNLIRENWVLIDLLHVWHQLGVDVLARMRELATGPDYDFSKHV